MISGSNIEPSVSLKYTFCEKGNIYLLQQNSLNNLVESRYFVSNTAE